jgi:hypothetical protein
MGLTLAQADLDWVSVDNYIWGYETRMQKQMEGHRLTAFFLYRAHFEAQTSDISAFYSLPLLDSIQQASLPEDASATQAKLAWLIRNKLKFGERFGWNPEPGTPDHEALEAARREAAEQAASQPPVAQAPAPSGTPPLSILEVAALQAASH